MREKRERMNTLRIILRLPLARPLSSHGIIAKLTELLKMTRGNASPIRIFRLSRSCLLAFPLPSTSTACTAAQLLFIHDLIFFSIFFPDSCLTEKKIETMVRFHKLAFGSALVTALCLIPSLHIGNIGELIDVDLISFGDWR